MSAPFPDASAFRDIHNAGKTQIVRLTLPADLETPVAAMIKLAAGKRGAFLFESVEGGEARGRYSVIGFAPDAIWRSYGARCEINRQAARDPDAFEILKEPPLDALRRFIAESRFDLPDGLPSLSAGLFGYMGYDMARHAERFGSPPPDAIGIPDSVFARPSRLVVFDSVSDTMICIVRSSPRRGHSADEAYDEACRALREMRTALLRPLMPKERGEDSESDEGDESGEGGASSSVSMPTPRSNMRRALYLEKVRRVKEYIFAGDIFQAVLSQRFSASFSLSPMTLYRSLRRINPSPYLYYLDFGDFSVVGSSPEILVRLREGVVTIRPIAGTRPRGGSAADDLRIGEELLSDPKERAEHLMLLDLGRNDVGRVSEIGSVRVTERFALQRTSHLIHIVSNVEGVLRRGLEALDALMAGFPAGTVSGAPKIRAMEIIDELEDEKRSLYAGAVGYFSANGDMDSCIALRTALIKDGVMYVQAGGGIVADSEPDYEYRESVKKAEVLFRAAQDVGGSR